MRYAFSAKTHNASPDALGQRRPRERGGARGDACGDTCGHGPSSRLRFHHHPGKSVLIEVKRKGHVQRMTYEEFEQRIVEGDIQARTPVRFELVTGDRFKPAGELELFQALADPSKMAFRRNLSRRGLPIVTALLVGIQLRIYLASWNPSMETWLQQQLTNWAPAILEQGQIWRLLSYGLLQIWFPHLLFNMLFLVYTGYHLERAVGRSNLLLVYFGSVVTGGALSMLMSMDRPSLGASGGVFGLLAAGVVVGWKYWEAIPNNARKYFGGALAWYIGYSLLSGLRSEGTDNWSHLGGLIGGALIMTSLDPEVFATKVRGNRIRRGLITAVLALSCLATALTGPRLVPLEPVAQDGWQVSRPTYWKEGWTFTGDRGWFSPTLQANLSAATTVHPRPLTAVQAADKLIERVSSGGREPQVISRQALKVAGWSAERVELTFDLSDETQHLTALVMARGVFEHRVVFQAIEGSAAWLSPLARRTLQSVRFGDPPELLAARKKAATHPRSWEPATELGEALYRAGEPQEALAAFDRARSIAPDHPRPVEGMLRVYADYKLDGAANVAHEALRNFPDRPDVIVAAADALDAAGQHDEGVAVLDKAWADIPGDRTLRRERLQWGLGVDLDGTGPDGATVDGATADGPLRMEPWMAPNRMAPNRMAAAPSTEPRSQRPSPPG